MKKLKTRRIILNIILLFQLIPLSMSYFGNFHNDIMLNVFLLNMLSFIIIPLVNIFLEVKIMFMAKINILSVSLILFNILMFFISAFHYGGKY